MVMQPTIYHLHGQRLILKTSLQRCAHHSLTFVRRYRPIRPGDEDRRNQGQRRECRRGKTRIKQMFD